MQREVVFDYRKLRGRIVEKFGTQGNFSVKVNLSDRSMSLKLNNGIGFSQDEIINWCELLDILLDDIPSYFFTPKV